VPAIRHAACWAHARRKFHELFEATGSPVAGEALARIAALYAIEAEITGQKAEQRRDTRQRLAVPLLADLKVWLESQAGRLSAKTALAKAIQYALGRWTALLLYTGDGRIGIDNNPAERSLRTIALTRKNFLFLGSEAGGKRAADLYTVLETARLNGLNPEVWLAEAIDRMAKGHPINRLDELLPWNWQDTALQLPA
jgi:transposase